MHKRLKKGEELEQMKKVKSCRKLLTGVNNKRTT